MFRLDLAELLRSQGHEVLCTFEMGQETADDSAVLGLAIREDRILVTMDEHFGDWATLPLDKHPGVIRVKIHPTTTTNIAGLLSPFLNQLSRFWEMETPPPPFGRRLQACATLPGSRNPI